MPNALGHEKSPYLLQHAGNPVQWLPWGEAAFARSRAEQKPIFLSIGYATCHWCHVMAHESFENANVAAVLNASFIPIKVDREERPDVDKVYMTYVQAVTGHGGWPLSAWLTPDLKPFYGGTYFPPDDRHGRPGFVTLLQAIAKGWTNEREKLVAEGERVIETLRDHFAAPATGSEGELPALVEAAASAFEKGFQHFYEAFDPKHGGFGGAPKFPRASNLNFLFRVAALQGLDSEAGAEAVKLAAATCRAMAQGGIHDHVGGGFHRYSVDDGWFVPHFEKMLYDQAQIALNLLEARQATGDERFAWIARGIFDYVRRDLTSREGGFYSAEDADSAVPSAAGEGAGEGHHAEGAFYVWTQAEITAALGDDAPLFCAHFGVAEKGNVPEALDPQHEFTGKNILMQRQALTTTAQAYGLTPEQASERLANALAILRAARGRRARPLRDDKVIAAWNGFMISAFARGHAVLAATDDAVPATSGGDSYLQLAVRAAEFLRRELFDEVRGVLFRNWRGERSRAEGFAEDYAAVIQGLLDLYEATLDGRWLEWAGRLQETMDARFWDASAGGYFTSPPDDPSIVLRLKEDYDGAEPAASSVAAMNLLRLSALFGSPAGDAYRDRGRRCVEAFRGQWTQAPHAMPQMLCALELALEEPMHVVLAGELESSTGRAMRRVLHARLRRRMSIVGLPSHGASAWLTERAPWLAGVTAPACEVRAYVCVEYACQAPVATAEALRELLDRRR